MTGLRLGSIGGFPLRIDLSWVILFFLVLWSFTTAVFPAAVPGLARSHYLGMGLAASLLFFGSLVAHEVAHAVVARRSGVPVEGISLFLLGGMARTRKEAATPGDELRIAIAGPLASLALAAVLAAFWGAAAATGSGGPVTGVLRYVAFLNLALALFNLLPGFPLDGGRVFRAIVWAATGDVTRATRTASTTGRLIGYALVLLGLVAAFTGNVVGGLWMVFIGWYLRQAALSGLEQHVLRSLLARVLAADAMTPAPVTVTPELSLRSLLDDYLLGRGYASLPVLEQGRAIGIVTLPQLRAVPDGQWPARTVREVMLPLTPSLSVAPDTTLLEAIERLGGSPVRRILVERDGVLVGIIAPTDITRWLEGSGEKGPAAVSAARE